MSVEQSCNGSSHWITGCLGWRRRRRWRRRLRQQCCCSCGSPWTCSVMLCLENGCCCDNYPASLSQPLLEQEHQTDTSTSKARRKGRLLKSRLLSELFSLLQRFLTILGFATLVFLLWQGSLLLRMIKEDPDVRRGVYISMAKHAPPFLGTYVRT